VDNPAEDIQQPYDTFVKAFFRTEMDMLVSHFLISAVRSHYSEMLLEFTKRLGRIQDVEALEKIEQAALVSDIQRVLSLVRANDPTKGK